MRPRILFRALAVSAIALAPLACEQQTQTPTQAASIAIEKATVGHDADGPPGPTVRAGDDMTWTYTVTNDGDVALTNVRVHDDQGVTVACPSDTLGVAESMTCIATGTVPIGPYVNVGTAVATPPSGNDVRDTDPSHCVGADPAIRIETYTQGVDGDDAPGPYVLVGDIVTWTYVVTNDGDAPIGNVAVTDDHGVTVTMDEGDVNADGMLDLGETWTYSAHGIAVAGPYVTVGSVTGDVDGIPVADADVAHHFGAVPSVAIEAAINGEDADTAPGLYVLVGDPVTWTYALTNDGNVTLTDVSVTTDPAITVDCPASTLAADEAMICTASGTATEGPQQSLASVEVSHYFGAAPAVDLELAINDADADVPPGPEVPVGDPVTWTYTVANTGNVDLTDVTIEDTQHGVVCVSAGPLPAGDPPLQCTLTGSAEVGQHAYLGTATGTPPGGLADVTDSDPSHYFGVAP